MSNFKGRRDEKRIMSKIQTNANDYNVFPFHVYILANAPVSISNITITTSFATKKLPVWKMTPKKAWWVAPIASLGWWMLAPPGMVEAKNVAENETKKQETTATTCRTSARRLYSCLPGNLRMRHTTAPLGFCWKIYGRVSFPNLQMKSSFSVVVAMFSDALNIISTASLSPHTCAGSNRALPCLVMFETAESFEQRSNQPTLDTVSKNYYYNIYNYS